MEFLKEKRNENLFSKIKNGIRVNITINFLYKLAVNQSSICVKAIGDCSLQKTSVMKGLRLSR